MASVYFYIFWYKCYFPSHVFEDISNFCGFNFTFVTQYFLHYCGITWKLQIEDRIKGYLLCLKLLTILIQLLVKLLPNRPVHLDFWKVFGTILFWNITAAVSARQKYVRHTRIELFCDSDHQLIKVFPVVFDDYDPILTSII